MKTKVLRPLAIAGALSSGILLNSCATLFAPKTTPVILVDAPSDLSVKVNGSHASIERVQSQAKSGSEVTVTYFAQGIQLDKKIKRQTITLNSGEIKGCGSKTKADAGVVFLDLMFTGPIGIGVDAATKRWRKAKNRHIDVPAILNGTEPRSQSKLKRKIRRDARSN